MQAFEDSNDGRKRVPSAAAILGAAGLIPFFWAVLALQTGLFAVEAVPPRAVATGYGLMIFSYMSGCFWPFAARSGQPVDYLLAVSPVLGLIMLVVPGLLSLNAALILGFASLLLIDGYFARRGIAPVWWMRLRVPLTICVVAALLAVLLTGPVGGAS